MYLIIGYIVGPREETDLDNPRDTFYFTVSFASIEVMDSKLNIKNNVSIFGKVWEAFFQCS